MQEDQGQNNIICEAPPQCPYDCVTINESNAATDVACDYDECSKVYVIGLEATGAYTDRAAITHKADMHHSEREQPAFTPPEHEALPISAWEP